MLILYSTNCPKCNVLKKKLEERNIEFSTVTDINVMVNKGFMEAPILEADDKIMNFMEAISYLKETY